ncbi:GIY-YIG nuclease family protein (plasmid) [Legionella lytica]|uniref:GIY-YIG nuclease family protein n=1 Tax=Legionella lytica TaxID=96232 RepID=A0ABY4YD29_9GAMM|nr:GIY-YIG nuclease family protein [Legionella lytica]USQ15543.1 GIY-YIG nuclease family protein [Legionella lytica]
MTELSHKKILILDCQTTGMHPSTGQLLQIGWSIYNPTSLHVPDIQKRTLKLNKELIPSKIKKMLRLTAVDLEHSTESQKVFNQLQQALNEVGPEPIVITHYAQFEKSFLKQFYLEHAQTDELNFKLFCSQKIAKRLLPQLPSHNLKAIAGYYKWPNTPKNEILSHVSMTLYVWQQLLPKLHAANVSCYSSLECWLARRPSEKKALRYEYNIERLDRLNLSEKPGVYRMLAEDGTILYIGKATSLKARVNSYFRGVKNRDRRKLEMLAQVWNIETIECDTPLEAALLESDEIKKWSPPYNVLLTLERTSLIFYDREYTALSKLRDSTYLNGPHKPQDALSWLMELIHALKKNEAMNYGEEHLSAEQLKNAWHLFLTTHHFEHVTLEQLGLRSCLVMGYTLLKQFERTYGKGAFQKWWTNEKKQNPEEDLVLEERMARKMARICLRAAEARRKSKMISRLYNSTLMIQSSQKRIIVVNGELLNSNSMPSENKEPPAFELYHYDRLSILLSALNNKTVALISD